MGMKAKSVNKFKALGMIDDIENSFLKAAELDKKHIETRWALVMLYIELPGIVGGSEKKALKYSDELMELSKVDGHLSKGYIDEYFNRYKKAETNRGLTIYFIGYLFIPIIPICLFVQFLKNRPHFNYKNQSKPIPLDIIVITTFIVTIIILAYTMPHFQFISNGEFYK